MKRARFKSVVLCGRVNFTDFFTQGFLAKKGLDKEKMIAWLNDKGGFCDCEVLFNVEPQFQDLVESFDRD